jgi:hypothetical protein
LPFYFPFVPESFFLNRLKGICQHMSIPRFDYTSRKHLSVTSYLSRGPDRCSLHQCDESKVRSCDRFLTRKLQGRPEPWKSHSAAPGSGMRQPATGKYPDARLPSFGNSKYYQRCLQSSKASEDPYPCLVCEIRSIALFTCLQEVLDCLTCPYL